MGACVFQSDMSAFSAFVSDVDRTVHDAFDHYVSLINSLLANWLIPVITALWNGNIGDS